MNNDLHIFRLVVYDACIITLLCEAVTALQCVALGLSIANLATAILTVRLSECHTHARTRPYIAVVKHRLIGRSKCDVHF